MTWMTFVPATRPARIEGEAHLLDYRQRRELEIRERDELKRVELANQSSELHSAGARIRAWEKVHNLRMPNDAAHPILRQIAATTHLTLADVLAEQQVRAIPRAAGGV